MKRFTWKVTIPRLTGDIVKEGDAYSLETAKRDARLAHGFEGGVGIGTAFIKYDGKDMLAWEDGKWIINAWKTAGGKT